VRINPAEIAWVIVHFSNGMIQALTSDLGRLARQPDRWPLVHEEFLLMLYCVTMSRFSRRLPQALRDPLWDDVAARIASRQPELGEPANKMMKLFQATPDSQASDVATRCFSDPRRIRAAIEDYLQYIEDRFEQALLVHPMVRLRFGQLKNSPIAVFESRLLRHLEVAPSLDPELLYALMGSAARIAGILVSVDEWVLAS